MSTRKLMAAAIGVVAVAGTFAVAITGPAAATDKKVDICHQKGNDDYVTVQVDRDAWDEHTSAHSDHEGDYLVDAQHPCPPGSRPTTTTGGPTTTTGGPTTTAGGPTTTAGGPTTTAGGPTTTAGGPTTTAGGPTTTAGGPTTTAGEPTTTAGEPTTTAGDTTTTEDSTTTTEADNSTTTTEPTLPPAPQPPGEDLTCEDLWALTGTDWVFNHPDLPSEPGDYVVEAWFSSFPGDLLDADNDGKACERDFPFTVPEAPAAPEGGLPVTK